MSEPVDTDRIIIIDVPFQRILVAVEKTGLLLKERFPNLSTEDTIRLANNIVRVNVRAFEGRETP